MVSLLATVAAATVAMTLLAAAVGHARRSGELTSALHSQGVLPTRLAGPVGATVITIEAALGLAVALGLALGGRVGPGLADPPGDPAAGLLGDPAAGRLSVPLGDLAAGLPAAPLGDLAAGLLVPGLAAAAVLFAAYTTYTEYLRRARQDAPPCGCAGGDVAVSGWVVGRAAALAGVAGLGWLLAPSVELAAGPIVDALTALFAAATFACLLWQLPAAMAQPAAATTARGAAGP